MGLPQIAPIYLIPAAVLAFIFFRYKTKLQLVARLMKVACDSLAANLCLVPFALGANISVIPPLVAMGGVIYALQGIGAPAPACHDAAQAPVLPFQPPYPGAAAQPLNTTSCP